MEKHINPELLCHYAIYLFAPDEPDCDGQRLSAQVIKQAQKHLANCKYCNTELNHLQMQLREIEEYLDKQSLPNLTLGQTKNPRKK